MNLPMLWQRLREAGSLMVGVPDYERYCEHMQQTHPELPVLSREAFVRNRMLARYGGKASGKCPC
ncbi:MAG: YbdD/YjiX family protein [Moraxellaceae bacterium]|nr:YbdD/YjiX family protein [Moraxellaceae bacterium]